MDDAKIGDVVKGYGVRHRAYCLLHVDKINQYPYEGGVASLSGRVVGASGKITTKEETILKSPRRHEAKINISNPDEPIFEKMAPAPIIQPGGWEVVEGFQIKGPTVTLASRIKKLEVGQDIYVPKTENPVESCRVSVCLISDRTGNLYTVNKTPDGCKITRTA